MQNTVYERKQNGEGFFSLPAVTYSRFGNCPANGLVTEQSQYSVIICIFSTWQNAETKLISNGLRFIFTCPLFLAQPITFHQARHSFASLITLEAGVPIETISRMLGHSDISTTQVYARVSPKKLFEDMDKFIKATEDFKLTL
ncbi:phage integrase family protein [Parabacteroides distasonis str. 3776 D15 i]|uniref:Phage integrase family protein n=1 Tax=Parabacteroides distasonis str. 3776 D15 i TaxID=1339342 RepID=A0AB34LEW5_PARDI|nr:phage integrase family protein [Parabacteroides distasonis str. 3776 D15 i]